MRALEAETATLREEVQRSRDQALRTEQQAKDDVNHEREKLKQAQEAVLAAEAMVREREQELIELKTGDTEQQEQLKRLEDQFDLVRREGAREVEVAERSSRIRGSEARVAQSECGVARARVAQLRQLAEEHRELLRRLQLEDVALEEARERHELSHIQDQLLMRTTVTSTGRGKKTSSSSFSSSPTRPHRSSSSKSHRPRGRDHHHPTAMPQSMSFSHILPPRFSQSPHGSQQPHRRRSSVDAGNSMGLDDFVSVDSPHLPSDREGDTDGNPNEARGGCGGGVGAGNISDSSLGLSTEEEPNALDNYTHSHRHSHRHSQGSESQEESTIANESEADPTATGDGVTDEAPSAIIQRMKKRMMTFSLSPTTTPEMLPSPSMLPSSSMAKNDGDGGHVDILLPVDNDKGVDITVMSSSSSFQHTSPGKTDREDEGVEDDEDYDEEEENRRYQVARSALRGIIQHTTTINNNNTNSNANPVHNHTN